MSSSWESNRKKIELDSDEDAQKLLKSSYQPAVSSSEFKEQLLERLRREVSATETVPHSRWGRPGLWVPIAASIISVAIGYGIWLSLTKVLT